MFGTVLSVWNRGDEINHDVYEVCILYSAQLFSEAGANNKGGSAFYELVGSVYSTILRERRTEMLNEIE